jgi:hypothetical protein
MAYQQLGWSEVPTIRLDHLTEAQARAFMIADNRLTENSVSDDRLLGVPAAPASPLRARLFLAPHSCYVTESAMSLMLFNGPKHVA